MTVESAGVPRAAAGGRQIAPTVWAPGPAPAPALGPASRTARPRSRRGSGHRAVTIALVTADCLAAAVTLSLVAGTELLLPMAGPVLVTLALLHFRCGLYRPGLLTGALDELPRLLGGSALTWCVATTVAAIARPAWTVGWHVLLALVLVHTLFGCAGRSAVHLVRRRNARRKPRSALVVGLGQTGGQVTSALHGHPEYGMRPVGLVEPGADPLPAPVPVPVPVLRSTEDITRAVIQNTVRDAVFTRGTWTDPRTAGLVALFTELGCTVWLVNDETAPGTHVRRPPAADHLWGFACVRLPGPVRNGPAARAGKRLLDLGLTLPGLLVAAPVLLACALAVRLADGPGVLFRQERIGAGGRPFVVLKFRTLVPADERESATRWSVARDRRMSPVGRFLRRTSLDELPQLWNVLRGDMSLVGPRPERPYFVEQFSRSHPGYADRHRMPTGITGLAQVNGLRGDTSIEDRARFDNHYIETWSPWQDVRILLSTVGSLFRFGGS